MPPQTNAAFTSALSALGYTSVADLAARDPTLLAAVVKNHVVSGRDLDSDDLVRASPMVTLAPGQTLSAVRDAYAYTLTSLGGATATIVVTDIDAGEVGRRSHTQLFTVHVGMLHSRLATKWSHKSGITLMHAMWSTQ